jgi:predicted glycoside hydrolase/deacetylase ChbG (UPF0249 family)
MSSPPIRSRNVQSPILGRVVFHADDLGLNSAVDDGILDAFTQGVLTSTAVLANGPSAETALARVGRLSDAWRDGGFARSHRRLLLDDPGEPFDIGVHLNLTQGRPLTANSYPSELLDDRGRFLGAQRLFAKLLRSRGSWLAPLRAELAAQIAWVVDHSVQPTHANGHQYCELFPGVRAILPKLLARFSIRVVRLPVERRLCVTTLISRGLPAWTLAHVKRTFAVRYAGELATAQIQHPEGFFGTAHAGRMSLTAISRRLSARPSERLLEIGIHPGNLPGCPAEDRSADGWNDPLASRRPAERELLCSQGLAELLADRRLGLGRLGALAGNGAGLGGRSTPSRMRVRLPTQSLIRPGGVDLCIDWQRGI